MKWYNKIGIGILAVIFIMGLVVVGVALWGVHPLAFWLVIFVLLGLILAVAD